MLIKNLIEPNGKKMSSNMPVQFDGNGNIIAYADKNGKSVKAHVKQSEQNYVEDKTSDDYIPKSYRSQSLTNRVLTGFLAYFGITFLQPIKWKNVLPIVILHAYCTYAFLAFPVFEIKALTVFWGK